MKKNLILMAALSVFSGVVQAATYTWDPMDGSTEWNDVNNWKDDQGGTPDIVPVVKTGDNNITIINGQYNVTYSGDAIPLYRDDIKVEGGANAVLNNITQLTASNLVVGEDSSLTIGRSTGSITINPGNTAGYDDMSWTIYGTLNITSALSWNQNKNPLNVDLGSSGTLNLTDSALKGSTGFVFSASLDGLILENAPAYQLLTRELVTGLKSTVTSSNMTITGGAEEVDNIAGLDLAVENAGKYQVFTQDGKVYVSYISGVVPEPASATLGLLGMSAFLLRRRRH